MGRCPELPPPGTRVDQGAGLEGQISVWLGGQGRARNGEINDEQGGMWEWRKRRGREERGKDSLISPSSSPDFGRRRRSDIRFACDKSSFSWAKLSPFLDIRDDYHFPCFIC